MSVESTIQSTLGALVSGRCYPLIAPDPVTAPYIVFAVISDVPETTLEGAEVQSHKRIQVDAYAAGYGAAKTLNESIKAAMAGVTTFTSVPTLSQDMIDPDVQLYRVSTDFSVWSKP